MEFPARRFRNLRPPLELAQLSSLPFVFAFPEVDARPPIRCSRKGGWLYEFPLALLSQERQSGIPLTVGKGRACRFWNPPGASRLAGRRKGFVYWPPGLVTIQRVGSLLIFRVIGQSKKKLQPQLRLGVQAA